MEDPAIREPAPSAHEAARARARRIAARIPKSRNVATTSTGSRPIASTRAPARRQRGTLAWFEKIHIELAELPGHKALGVAHFPRFHDAMEATRHIVKLGPCAVELVDRTMLDLALSNPAFAPIIRKFVKGAPEAVLLVEFAGGDRDTQAAGVARLGELMGDLGFADAVVPILDAAGQKSLWDVRKAGLNIMMSMKGDGKPVSFIEDCAVPLEHLAEYTAGLTEIFRKHGTEGTFYAHASVGCLHVRPVLNMKGDGRCGCAPSRKKRPTAPLQGLLFRRARRRHCVRVDRAVLGPRLRRARRIKSRSTEETGESGKIVNPPKQDDAR